MYTKILKETASQLTLLAVENDTIGLDTISKNLSRFFKAITYVSSVDEAIWLCRSEKFDLILVSIDSFCIEAHRFIESVQKLDAWQAIGVCSANSNHSELLLELLNNQIACFIPKPVEPNTMYQILSKVCGKIHDRQILMHYIETLEHQHEKALSVSRKSGCSMKVELKSVEPIFIPTMQTVEEEDEFMFFPEPSSGAQAAAEENSIYQDYFNFLDGDDREELHDQLSDIDTSLLSAFSDRGADPQSVNRLGNSLMRYGNVLLHYQFFSDMGTSILEFGKTISDESVMIAERSGEFQMLISGFCSGLQTYMFEVWDKESDNPKFFNDSIINDATTIIGMMEPPKVSDGGDDDLFFF